MGILSGAIQRNTISTTPVHSPKGMYNGFFIGLTAPFEYVSPWPNDPCKGCDGTKRSRMNETMPCARCGGTGNRVEMHIKLRYQLETGTTEEEEVTFKISPPSSGVKNGVTVNYSPSTLYLRLREFSGIPNATEEQLDYWYSSLTQPIQIPIVLVVGDNKTGSSLKITGVQLRGQAVQPAPQVQYAPPQPSYGTYSAPPGGPNNAGPIPAAQFGQYGTQAPPPQAPPPPLAQYASQMLPDPGGVIAPKEAPAGYEYDGFGRLVMSSTDAEIPF